MSGVTPAPGAARHRCRGLLDGAMNLEISPWFVIWPRAVMVMGLSMVFAPISVAAFKYTPEHPSDSFAERSSPNNGGALRDIETD